MTGGRLVAYRQSAAKELNMGQPRRLVDDLLQFSFPKALYFLPRALYQLIQD